MNAADALRIVDRFAVEHANDLRRAIERLRRKASRAAERCRWLDADALRWGAGSLEVELAGWQWQIARACAPWFEVRAC